ncbi:MAG: DUF2845 domain-containing protein [Hyphomicrobiales bacterium]|jgi:hypothetical protein
MFFRLSMAVAICFSAETSALALSCGTRFIVEGQSDYEVLKLCGPPSWTNNRFAFVPVNPGVPYGYGPQQGYLAPVEDWIYDLGSTKLMERLTFSNGRVIRIETLGYGG